MVYFMKHIDRIKQPDYVVTKDDMLHVRVRTSGITTDSFVINGVPFEVYDVGGQRTERKKWVHCFEEVTAVMFVAALSEFDHVLYEDSSKNRMVEAIELFDTICNSNFFARSSIILFLNKKDLFMEKITVRAIASLILSPRCSR